MTFQIMIMKSDKIVWGLLFLFAGIILLLDNFGVISFYWGSIWRLWPLLLVLWGAELLLKGRKSQSGPWIIGGITLVVLIFVGYYGSNKQPDEDPWTRRFEWNTPERHRPAEFKVNRFKEPYSNTIQRAELNIHGGATRYSLKDTTSSLFEAEVRHQFARYSLTRTSRGGVEVLSLKMPDSTSIRGSKAFSLNQVEMQLNNKVLWDINLEMGAGNADLDLSGFRIASLNIEGGASSFDIKLGDLYSSSNVTVEAGVSQVQIAVPSSVGCIVRVDSGLSSNDFEGFIKQDDGVYMTDNYNSSSRKIRINLEGGVSDFEIRRY